MRLPDREQQELDEIERRLADDDPKLAAKLTRPPPRVPRRTMRVVAVVMLYVLGLMVLMAGVTLSSVVLIALGACVMLGVFAWFAVRSWRRHRE